jgi:DNA-directed RNA polymerase specialized sigma24 family protein
MIAQARPAIRSIGSDARACRPVSPGSGLMQPPTEPTPAAAPAALRGDEGDLYRRHHDDLRRAVAHAVNAPRELIDDACQNAWTIMLRAQPDRTTIFGWLYVVATREAFRLCARERRHTHLEAMLTDGSWDAVITDGFSIDDILEAREALQVLASLPDRQRADLTLLVAGFSYREIAQLTGGRTYTNVNRHIAKARARVRLARLAAADHTRDRLRPDVA